MNKRIIKLAILIVLSLCFYQTAFGCGVPQTIHGRAVDGESGVFRAYIHLETVGGGDEYLAMTNMFGHYTIYNVTPCNEYEMTIDHKFTEFEDAFRLIYIEPDAEGYEINFVAVK